MGTQGIRNGPGLQQHQLRWGHPHQAASSSTQQFHDHERTSSSAPGKLMNSRVQPRVPFLLPKAKATEVQLRAWNDMADIAAKNAMKRRLNHSLRSTWYDHRCQALDWECSAVCLSATIARQYADFLANLTLLQLLVAKDSEWTFQISLRNMQRVLQLAGTTVSKRNLNLQNI